MKVKSEVWPTSPKFPEDFDDGEHAKQKSVISWLLNHDPAKRPTATELLKSELLPPPQMEESELHEVLHHTLTNVDGKAYRTMMAQIFSQRISPAIDYTYDSDILKGNFSIRTAKMQQHVCETIIRIFKRHGAVQLCTPLLLPRNRQIYEHNEAALFMDHSGMLVMLPFDLRSFTHIALAANKPSVVLYDRKHAMPMTDKGLIPLIYCIERVFRPRKLDRFHPKELLECAFDIVTSTTNSFLPTAEIIYTIYEIIQEFPALQGTAYESALPYTPLHPARYMAHHSVSAHESICVDKLTITILPACAYDGSLLPLKLCCCLSVMQYDVSGTLAETPGIVQRGFSFYWFMSYGIFASVE
ncbi:Eukaryotic translation initiation factor 2 alpha kinase 4 [Saguinus oedipus]|uniref:Histidyl-tRNA synthetase n=1 Tax=Saguinus oedipus TaxID=9490 RepID=A0ABQ9V359_SAGOE|nr:Eukaryotic translation initiation factor 2 alpha kinase 4 [Saguinus oedipus]